jgi:hypothetical protein
VLWTDQLLTAEFINRHGSLHPAMHILITLLNILNMQRVLQMWWIFIFYIWWSWSIVPNTLNLSISWRWVVSSTPWLLYSWEKRPQYSQDRRLVWAPEPVLDSVEKRKFSTLARNQILSPGCPACNPVTIMTELSQLHGSWEHFQNIDFN